MEARARRQSPFVLSKAEVKSLTDAGDLPYDFSFAQRIQDIENEFKIPVTSSGGAKGRLRLLNAGETRSFAQDFDIRLQEDTDAALAFNNVRDELMDAEGGLRIAAEREIDIEREILAKVLISFIISISSFLFVISISASPPKIVLVFDLTSFNND